MLSQHLPLFKSSKNLHKSKYILSLAKDDFLKHLFEVRDSLSLSEDELKKCNDFLNNRFHDFYTQYTDIMVSFDEKDFENLKNLKTNNKIEKLYLLYEELNNSGYTYVNGRKINFWSGLEAKKKVKESEGFNDGNIPVIAIFFYLVQLIRMIEKEHYPLEIPSLAQNLAEINTCMYACGARDSIDVYISSDKKLEPAGLTAGNHFWNFELPILQQLYQKRLVKKITIHVLNQQNWQSFIFNKVKLPIYRRVAYHPESCPMLHDSKPSRFQSNVRMFSNSEDFKIWSNSEARPSSSTATLHFLKYRIKNKQKQYQKKLTSDVAFLSTVNEKEVPDGRHASQILKTNMGNAIFKSIKLLEWSGPWGFSYRLLYEFGFIELPTFFNNKKLKLLTSQVQYGNYILKALTLLHEAESLNEDSINLILKKPEKAVAIAKSYIKIMNKLSSVGCRWVEDYTVDIILAQPEYAPEAIAEWYRFMGKQTLSNPANNEAVRKSLLLEDIIVQSKIWIEICYRLYESGSFISSLMGYSSWCDGILTKDNINKLITNSHYLCSIHEWMMNNKDENLTQAKFDWLIQNCANESIKFHDNLSNKYYSNGN